MTSFYDLVFDLNHKFQLPTLSQCHLVDTHRSAEAVATLLSLRAELIEEESLELLEAIRTGAALKDVLKEACDLLYVTFGLFVELEMRPEPLFREVHASNMSKVDANGRPVFNANGKYTKAGTQHWKASMDRFVSSHARSVYEGGRALLARRSRGATSR